MMALIENQIADLLLTYFNRLSFSLLLHAADLAKSMFSSSTSPILQQESEGYASRDNNSILKILLWVLRWFDICNRHQTFFPSIVGNSSVNSDMRKKQA